MNLPLEALGNQLCNAKSLNENKQNKIILSTANRLTRKQK